MKTTPVLFAVLGLTCSPVCMADRSGGADFSDYYQKALVERGFQNTTTAFVGALSHADPTIRMFAAQALGERLDPGSVAALTAALSDGSATVRFYAARSLVSLKSAAGAAVLRDALLESGNVAQSVEAAGLLAELGDPSGYKLVLSGLGSANSSVRLRAIAELPRFQRFEGRLSETGPIDAVAALSKVVASGIDVASRVNAAYLLGKTGDPRARTALVAAAAGSDKAVANAASIGLAMLDGRR